LERCIEDYHGGFNHRDPKLKRKKDNKKIMKKYKNMEKREISQKKSQGGIRRMRGTNYAKIQNNSA